MDLEQRLRESYAERLTALDVPAGDPSVARATGGRMRVRRRAAVAGAALAVAALALAGIVDGRIGRSEEPAAPPGSWRELPAAPLSPRALALGVWTGREVLYLGGETRPCPPTVSCDLAMSAEQAARAYGYRRDGAAYDPGTNTWRPIAPAPGYVEDGSVAAFAAGSLYVSTTSGWYRYRVADDSWSAFDARWATGGTLSVVGDVIYGLSHSGKTAVAFDAGTARWTTYPRDTVRPRIGGFTVSGTPSGPVLGGYDPTKPYDVHRGSPALVDAWDGHGWRRLPMTGQMEHGWVWTGRRLVDPAVGYQDHGDEHRWPQAYPYGGILDPVSGAWSPLPQALEKSSSGWDVVAEGWPASVGGGDWFVVDGRLYDDGTGRVWTLPRPPGAPVSYAAAVLADGRLIAFGGADYSGQKLVGATNRAWVYTPRA